MKLICIYILVGKVKIIKILIKTFPKIQFIFTTHSPSVISNILNENILVLNNLEIYKLNDKTYGRNIESIVREVMKTEVRPQEIVKKLKEFNELLDDGKIKSTNEYYQKDFDDRLRLNFNGSLGLMVLRKSALNS